MLVALIRWNITNIKVLRYNRTAGSRKKPCLCADTEFLYTCRHIEIFVRKSLMNTGHDFLPEILVEVSRILWKFLVIVKSRPYCTGIIWCISYKPQVIVCICSTSLTCDCHIIKLARCTCTLCHNILHCTCKKPCCTFFDNRTSGRCFLDQDIAIMIQDFGIIKWFNIISTVCDCRVSCTQFYVCDTICQTTECQWEVCICPHCSISITICFCAMCQCCKSKIVQILKSQFRCNFLQAFDSNNVDRILDCLADRGCSIITSRCIVNW